MSRRKASVSVEAGGDANGPAPKLQLPATCEPPSEANPPATKVWVIFGATGHIGRSLVKVALAKGDKVTAVGRTYENTSEQMNDWHVNCLGTLCDVRLKDTVDAVIQETINHFGCIDIIANCTGYGVVAAAEDQSHDDVVNQFNTNFLGTLHIIQSSLAYFRTNSIPGRYLIFSSTAGALGVPGLAPYCATKYAVEGLVESMLYETDVFNIKATLVEPGHLRLDDNDTDMPALAAAGTQANTANPILGVAGDSTSSNRSFAAERGDRRQRFGHFYVKPNPSPAYSTPTSPAGHAKRIFQWLDARQPTSAVRSAELVWQLGHCTYPPLRLLLGSYAVESIRDRLRSVLEELEDWRHLSFGEDGKPVVNPGHRQDGSAGRRTSTADPDPDSSELNPGDDQDWQDNNQLAVDEDSHMMM